MKTRHVLFLLATILLLGSCAAPKNIAYFQDMDEEALVQIMDPSRITLEPEDKISIVVKSRDAQLTDMFNLPYVTRYLGQVSYTSNQGISSYTVDYNGDIDFPVLGRLHIAGMTRDQVAAHIKDELVSKNLVKDPVVIVEFMNLKVSILGEVKTPGRYSIEKDNVTLLDVIGMAGDLTIYGNREDVTVLREENGHVATYKVNLCSGNDLYSSPVFYMQQNDLVYVYPNDAKKRQSTVNGNNIRSTSFWISIASLIATVINILI